MDKVIKLTQNKETIVDEETYEWASKFKWFAIKSQKNKRCYFTAGRQSSKLLGKQQHILLHREILNAPTGMMVDHINGNTLDNRKSNLRLCTNAENQRNRKKTIGTISQYKGVSWNKRKKKWQVQICYNRKCKHLGYFLDEKEAALRYNKEAIKLYGEFAKLNEWSK